MGFWVCVCGIVQTILLRWESLPTVGKTIPWQGSWALKWREGRGSNNIYHSIFCVCDVTSCFKLLLRPPPCHGGLYLQL